MKKLIGLLLVFASTLTYGQINNSLPFSIVITNNDDPLDEDTLYNIEFQLYYFQGYHEIADLEYYNHTVTNVFFDYPQVSWLDTAEFYFDNDCDCNILKITTTEGYITKLTNTTHSLNVNNTNVVEFNVFPNPTTDYINLSTEGTSVLYDLYGNKVLEASTKQIDIRHLPKGMYIISVNNSKQLIQKQ